MIDPLNGRSPSLAPSRLLPRMALGMALGTLPLAAATETIEPERPEAWAMTWFDGLQQPGVLDSPHRRPAGTLTIGLDGTYAPHLDTEQRRVGFDGTKVEDLNRTPVIPRLMGSYHLLPALEMEVGWIPPAEVDDIRSNYGHFALHWTLWQEERWAIGVRGWAMAGRTTGSITCTEDEAAHAPFSDGNPFGCLEKSDDEAGSTSGGIDAVVGYRSPEGTWRFFAGGGWARRDMDFQVDARLVSYHDRTRLETTRSTVSAFAGINWSPDQDHHLGAQVFYLPLEVDRGDGLEDDDLLTLRLGYRLILP